MSSPTPAATGTWTKAGDLPAAAGWYGQYDGAVVLKTGKVLLVGGTDASSAATKKTALFDPAGPAPTWTAGPPMQSPRRLHSVTLLDSGKVLVVGGTSGSAPTSPGLTSVELYTPGDTGGTWETVTGLREARWGHSAVLLENKKVLVAGGFTARSGDSVRALASAEIYDPATGKWSDATAMTDARGGHTAVLFKGGSVLVAGGTAPVSATGETSLAFCELYTPNDTGGTWAPTGSLLQPRSRHQTVLASDTTALVIGGATPGTAGDGTFDPYRSLTGERYDLATRKWAPLPDVPVPPLKPGGRAHHRVAPLGSGKYLLVGGTADTDNGVGYQSALIYDEPAKSWRAAAGLTDGRWAFAAVALSAGKVLVTGGTVAAGIAAADPDTAELAVSTEVFSSGGGA